MGVELKYLGDGAPVLVTGEAGKDVNDQDSVWAFRLTPLEQHEVNAVFDTPPEPTVPAGTPEPPVDPRDAEIEKLKADLAAAQADEATEQS